MDKNARRVHGIDSLPGSLEEALAERGIILHQLASGQGGVQ